MTDAQTARIAGQTLLETKTSISRKIVALHFDRRPRLWDRYGADGFEKCVNDVAYHVATLAAAVQFDSSVLFREYLTWARSLLIANQVDDQDVLESLECLRDVLREEFAADLGAVVDQCVSEGMIAFADTSAPELALPRPTPLGSLARAYLDALLARRRNEAVRLILEAVHSGVSINSIYLDVFQPCQREVGRLWQVGQISVGLEHYCTAATQLVMSQLYPHILSSQGAGPVLVATSVSEELHELGLRIVTDMFELSGWRTVYLGANVPTASVLEAVRSNDASILAISATMSWHLPRLAELIRAVRKDPDLAHVRVLAGGYPFQIDPFLWRKVGADAGARDAQEALQTAARLCPGISPEPTTPRSGPDILPFSTPDLQVGGSNESLTQLNNELVTMQRSLAQAHVELQRLYEEKRSRQTELEAADRQKDRFLATLAHELRGPLSPMSAAVDLLQSPAASEEDRKDAVAILSRQIGHMNRLVSDLLDMSRVIHGAISLQREPVELESVIGLATEMALPLIDRKRHRFQRTGAAKGIWIDGDATRLAQILVNLLTNAAKYTLEEGEIELSVRPVRDHVEVAVRDNGLGIAPELLPRVFELFSQLDPGRQLQEGGLGLGLSVVRELVELHGGIVEAASDGPGCGSVFTVRLPILERAPKTSAFLPGTSEPLTPKSVLVVDDTSGTAHLTARLLEILGHQPRVVLSGVDALAALDSFQPDIVLLDMRLPDIDGAELAAKIRSTAAGRNVRIVALTGSSDAQTRERARGAGVDDYLVKPVSLEMLRSLSSLPAAGGTVQPSA